MPTPELLLGREARDSIKRGTDSLARLLALTLGPTPRTILTPSYQRALPEALLDAATIARRFVGLPDRAESVGALLLRNLVWRQHLRVGDGCATVAVLTQALLAELHRLLAGGISYMALRRGVEQAVATALEALRSATRPLENDQQILALAQSICTDQRLSLLIAELFDILGANASITIERFAAPYLEREYIAGGRWKARLASGYFAQSADPRSYSPQRALLNDAAVVLFAGDLESVEDVVPLLELLAATEKPQLVLIARHISGPALTTLVVNHQRGLLPMIAVELQEIGARCDRDLQDLAALTGATIIDSAAGDRLRHIRAQDLGRARRIEADQQMLSIAGWRSHAAIRERILALQSRMAQIDPQREREEYDELRARIGRLSHGTAILKIGAGTEAERELLDRQAEQCLRALPAAISQGILPGGGIAYLHAATAVTDHAGAGDQRYGAVAVAHALAQPLRQIVLNAGMREPSAVLADLHACGPQWGYDAQTNTIAPLSEIGLSDSAAVLCEALQIAASGALIALSTEVLVLKRNPETSFEP